MENKDFVIERILSIEDFENISENLMAEINSNDEYRRIFDEYKEISALARDCIPEPVKDGVTLKDAVMNRVKSGDTAPRFLNVGGKTRFPFATAASVAVILAAVLVSTVVTRVNDRKSAENMNFAPDMEDNGAVYNYSISSNKKASGENTGIYLQDAVAEEEQVQRKYEIKAAPGPESKKAKESGTESFIKDDTARVQANSVNESPMLANGYNYSDEEVPDIAVAEAASEYEQKVSGAVYEPFDALTVSFDGTVREAQEECETVAVSSEVVSRLDYAEEFSVPDEKKIYPEDIEKYGVENFIAWFDGICDSADFEELYGIDEFIKYCENVEN